ncbi:MAG: hotdog domain-containing protein [Candidatus Sericytochromatia bacterium]|nr:hotdog domain-containing protein [Candidatus Sericytochromatia bacterium]
MTSLLRVRIGEHDAHYAGGLVAGGALMTFFGDVATELLIRLDGDEGLFVAYDMVEFKAPVHAGDYLEIRGDLLSTGNTSRKMQFTAHKVIQLCRREGLAPSAAELLPEPLLVARASGTCVTPKPLQRF